MEENFNYPKTLRPKGQIQTSVLVSQEFYELAKRYNIRFSEATRVGLALIFAEMGIMEYDNKLNLYRKMQMFRAELEKISKSFEELKEK